MSPYLDDLAKLAPVCREAYEGDVDSKPNNHCNWERLLPTTSSDFGWVENDSHFRYRVKSRSNNN